MEPIQPQRCGRPRGWSANWTRAILQRHPTRERLRVPPSQCNAVSYCTPVITAKRRTDRPRTPRREKSSCVHGSINRRMVHTAPDRPISSDRNIAIVFRRGDHLADNHRLGATHPADRWIRLGTIFQSRTCGLEKPCDPMLLR